MKQEEIDEWQSLCNDILHGRVCAYCLEETKLVNSQEIYGEGRDYGWMYWCKDCDAHVGCHHGSITSKGRVANASLRALKIEAHKYFDNLWKKKIAMEGVSKTKARRAAYSWLSETMKIDPEFTHIGMFTENECRKVIEICKPYYNPKYD